MVSLALMLPAAAATGPVDTRRVIDVARRAEAAGFDGVYVGDHLLHPRQQLEALVTLSAVAASTQRITVGTCVLLLALRDPLVTTKQLCSIAAFAPGRLRVGVGVGGEYPAEFELAGVPLAERGRRLEAALVRVRDLMANDIGGELSLAPVAPDVPFFTGGWSEGALRRAAEHADGWVGYLLKPDSFRRRREKLVELRGESFPTGMLVPVHLDHDAGSAADHWSQLTGKPTFPEHLFVAGSREHVADRLGEYEALGCSEFVFAVTAEGDDLYRQLDGLAELLR